jgi:hypothetical protein
MSRARPSSPRDNISDLIGPREPISQTKRQKTAVDLNIDPEDSTPQTKRQKITADTTSPLCTICQDVNLDEIFDAPPKKPEIFDRFPKAPGGSNFYNTATVVHLFKERLSNPSSCPLCKFFRLLRIQPDQHKRHKLLAFRSSESWLFREDRLRERDKEMQHVRDTVFMAVVPDIEGIPKTGYDINCLNKDVPATGAIYCVHPNDTESVNQSILLTARERKDAPNLKEVKSLLDICRDNHGKACQRRTSHESVSRSFRVIDCYRESYPPTLEEKPWETTYAALSYVWGTTTEDLKDWPETVLAAIEVTKKLGLQYLWVDRCCINQNDPVEKAYLISRMTTIYEAADFTIVAAAGSGASHGLPGMRSAPRTPQPEYFLDSGSILVSTMRDPRLDILGSPYWTRGWTYQEGVLSNRRIVFTDDQWYWECRCMAYHETIQMTLYHIPQAYKENPDSVLDDFMLGGIFKSDAFTGGSASHAENMVVSIDVEYPIDYGFPVVEEANERSQLRGLNEHIREFSKRNLTKNEDTLPAFQGIVGLYEQAKSIYLFHGLPMWTGDITGGKSGPLITFALSVSSWYHRASLDHAMFVSEACTRKPHLPSWTWGGWKGVVAWRAPPNLEHCAYMTDLIKATSGNIVWAANIYLYNPGRVNPNRLLSPESAQRLESEAPTLMEIRNPQILNTYQRIEDTEREWRWVEMAGRPGREMHSKTDKDVKWYRIGKRLSCIGMSVTMTPQEWTAKHATGELVSVLIFAGRYHDNEHGSARFMTLRKVSYAPERWERVGTLYLIIPFLQTLFSSSGLFHKIPASGQNRVLVIQ